jgi:ribosomal protein L21
MDAVLSSNRKGENIKEVKVKKKKRKERKGGFRTFQELNPPKLK